MLFLKELHVSTAMAAWLASAVGLLAASSAWADVSFQGFGAPANPFPDQVYEQTGVTALSRDGSVAFVQARANFPFASGGVRPMNYRWTPGMTPQRIGNAMHPFEGPHLTIEAASSDGSVAVGESNIGFPSLDSQYVAFRLNGSSVEQLGVSASPGLGLYARAVSADGRVAAGTVAGVDGLYHGVLFPTPSSQVTLPSDGAGGHMVGVGLTADGVRVTGTSYPPDGTATAVYWDNAGMPVRLIDSHPGTITQSATVSANGAFIIGDASDDEVNRRRLFIWNTLVDAYEVIDNNEQQGDFTIPTATNSDGSVIVGVFRRLADNIGVDESFIWTREQGFRKLADVLAEVGMPASEWLITGRVVMSDDGLTLAGEGIHTGFGREAWVAHIPSPPTSTLVLAAMLGAARRDRHRR